MKENDSLSERIREEENRGAQNLEEIVTLKKKIKEYEE